MTVHSVVHDFTGPMPTVLATDLQGRLREIGKGIPGRLGLTLYSDSPAVLITHWYPPRTASTTGGMNPVCYCGDVEDALQAAREYVEGFR